MTTPASAFDPVKYKSTTRAQWDNAAEAWHRWGPAGFEGPCELVVAVGTK